jgi:hypothetical protein
MICDKYRGKNTGPQCVKIKVKEGILKSKQKVNIKEYKNGDWK